MKLGKEITALNEKLLDNMKLSQRERKENNELAKSVVYFQRIAGNCEKELRALRVKYEQLEVILTRRLKITRSD